MQASERRRHTRSALARPAKLRCGRTGRYLAATTQDVSAGGARLRLGGEGRLIPGQSIRLGISDHPRQALLIAHAMIDATIVRSLGHDGDLHVAVQFDQPMTLAIAG